MASLMLLLILAACSKEARDIGPSAPMTPPHGADDPRIVYFQANVYQIAQGGRYFRWYGCTACHAEQSPGRRNLTDPHWHRGGTFDQVYAAVADGHGALAYRNRIPVEPLWQIVAYVRDLSLHTVEKRRRVAIDGAAEPEGARWSGPL
ncbi:MAG TPA: cytochrome c [Sphingomonas sp.]|uniref:c-type cytochrome n=1 Tax=Sphingomonas sp. TaxID=28214 RepID=UPI002ED97DDB